MNLFFLNFAKTTYLGDVFHMRNNYKFCIVVMIHHMEDTLAVRKPSLRFFNPVFIGLLCLKMLTLLLSLPIGANGHEIYPRGRDSLK